MEEDFAIWSSEPFPLHCPLCSDRVEFLSQHMMSHLNEDSQLFRHLARLFKEMAHLSRRERRRDERRARRRRRREEGERQ